VSFAGASVLVGGDQCGVGFVDAPGDIVETGFYEDQNCLATGQAKAGDVDLSTCSALYAEPPILETDSPA
jgi:hypothetical protein